MSTSFLFVQSLTDEGCYCLRLAKDASIEAPLAHRTFADVKLMQQNSQTVVVLSSQWAGFYTVELPWLPERKARAAIPFALEEQLAQKIGLLHFAYDRAHHQNNRYLVAVMEKSWLAEVVNHLKEAQVDFNELTLDWCALKPDEVCLTPSSVLVNTPDYQGALIGQLAQHYLSNQTPPDAVLQFTDSASEWRDDKYAIHDLSFFTWTAQRLLEMPRLNIGQGEFLHQSHNQGLNRSWLNICVTLAGALVISILAVNVVNIMRLNHQLNQLDKEIAVVYREFFPNAPNVISPRFRISQLLKGGETKASVLWPLLDRLEKTFDPKQLTLDQLQYRHATLLVNVKGSEVVALEALNQRLTQEQVKVTQTQAASHEGQVSASLELKL